MWSQSFERQRINLFADSKNESYQEKNNQPAVKVVVALSRSEAAVQPLILEHNECFQMNDEIRSLVEDVSRGFELKDLGLSSGQQPGNTSSSTIEGLNGYFETGQDWVLNPIENLL